MRYLVVDDEAPALRQMQRILTKVDPKAEVVAVSNSADALTHKNEDFHAVFLDINLPGMSGIDLAKELLAEKPQLNIIFVTAYDEYALDAYGIYASGYLTKPVIASDIQQQLLHLRYGSQALPKVKIQCFGQFEVFCGNEPMVFERKSSKEILAYLIDLRGASATREEICSAIWETAEEVERRKSYFRTLMLSLRESLDRYGMKDILICRRNSYSINTQDLNCDYYRYLNGDTDPNVAFRGEYMIQYAWAEKTCALLNDYIL